MLKFAILGKTQYVIIFYILLSLLVRDRDECMLVGVFILVLALLLITLFALFR